MRLKKILVHGFKSFADRTAFHLEGRGMTCIVGPNGCGKSNVIDSVKWILGEQRPTSLRGKEMTDVIFNGTTRRPPMGLCEGVLIFDNSCRTLPVDEDEVRITRRAFRSGETEYLLNEKSVRLKDIRDTLAGTGLGQGGYAFMEQGKIDSILASAAVDRRRVFEEAAGISRFRTRKRESELKLNRVEDNLLRLGDITEEIERQIRSLKIQAGKARNHREMSERMRSLQIRYNRHRYVELQQEKGEVSGQIEALGSEREERIAEREALRECVRETGESFEAARTTAEEGRALVAELGSQERSIKEKLGLHADHRDRARERIESRRSEIEQLEARLEEMGENLVVTRREYEDLQKDAGQITSQRQAKEEEVRRLEGELAEKRREVSEAEAVLRGAEDEMHRLARELARLESSHGHQESRLDAIEERRGELHDEREATREKLHERSGLQESQTSNLEDRRARLSAAEDEAEAREDAYVAAFDAVGARELEASRMGSRRDLVRGLFEAREGLDSGTRAILEERDARPEFLPGFHGLLIDLLEIDVERAGAIAIALGDLASSLVVETMDDVRAALGFLEEREIGGATFLVRELFPTEEGSLPEGVRVRDAKMSGVVSALLEGLEVVSAEALSERLAAGDLPRVLVSAEHLLVREGREVRVAGNGEGQADLVVLSAELTQLEKDLPVAEQALSEAREALETARSARDEARAQVKSFSVELVKEEGEAARLDQEILRFVREIERLDAETERLAEDARRLQQDRDETRERLQKLGEQRGAAEKAQAGAEEEVERRRTAAHAAAQVSEEGRKELQSLRIEETRLGERRDALRDRERHLERSLEETHQRGGAAREEAEGAEDELGRLVARIATEEKVLEEIAKKLAEASAEAQKREGEALAVKERLADESARLEALEERLGSLADGLGGFKGREGELRAALESLRERTREELDLDPDELFDHAEEVDAEEHPEGGWRAVEKEIKELRTRIARLGNVNLAAVEELQAAEERSGLLFREKKDLEESRQQLQEILKSIEERSVGLFMKTFDAVRGEFSDIFRRLFGGGKAEISLEDPEHPLESGIEIKARPPGKELRSIGLLSGGERTMTAVALLFAIFRSNPAPCMFLDEVDAALDEDNIDRFCRMLEEFVERSQFVIVTHSRRTMEQADLLMGVTMPERGVSRPVAVELEQVGNDGAISVPRRGKQGGDDAPAADDASTEPADSSADGDSEGDAPQASRRSAPARKTHRKRAGAASGRSEQRLEAATSARRVKPPKADPAEAGEDAEEAAE